MLSKFKVENFKNFEDMITFDLSNPCNYDFASDVVSKNCLTKALVYGPNGSGKSNLGLALFDIVVHLTDKEKLLRKYIYYVNMNSELPFASFEYVFSFHGSSVVYKYSKQNAETLISEQLFINEKEVVFYDFLKNEGFTKLRGTETLNLSANKDRISRIKYIKSNSLLVEDESNRLFNEFISFVDRMLLFFSLDKRGYQGFSVGTGSIAKEIIESNHVHDFQSFLQEQGLNYQLFVKTVDDDQQIYCRFKKKEANFFAIASTGTVSLALFYYWYIQMKSASLVFIDEFDAFYHFELSKSVVLKLRDLSDVQVILTTHNTDLLSNDLLRPDCYFLINSQKMQPLSSLTEKELRKAHNLQKMYKAGAFNE